MMLASLSIIYYLLYIHLRTGFESHELLHSIKYIRSSGIVHFGTDIDNITVILLLLQDSFYIGNCYIHLEYLLINVVVLNNCPEFGDYNRRT